MLLVLALLLCSCRWCFFVLFSFFLCCFVFFCNPCAFFFSLSCLYSAYPNHFGRQYNTHFIVTSDYERGLYSQTRQNRLVLTKRIAASASAALPAPAAAAATVPQAEGNQLVHSCDTANMTPHKFQVVVSPTWVKFKRWYSNPSIYKYNCKHDPTLIPTMFSPERGDS